MKTNLTGMDLLIMHNVLIEQLRVCNIPEGYKQQCVVLANKISTNLNKLKIEMKE